MVQIITKYDIMKNKQIKICRSVTVLIKEIIHDTISEKSEMER